MSFEYIAVNVPKSCVKPLLIAR